MVECPSDVIGSKSGAVDVGDGGSSKGNSPSGAETVFYTINPSKRLRSSITNGR